MSSITLLHIYHSTGALLSMRGLLVFNALWQQLFANILVCASCLVDACTSALKIANEGSGSSQNETF
jgi:hypothetical protein